MTNAVVNWLAIFTLGKSFGSLHPNVRRATSVDSAMRSFLVVVGVVLVLLPNSILGQTLTRRPEHPTVDESVTSVPQPTTTSIHLTVPAGMALKVALDQTVRIRRVGQPTDCCFARVYSGGSSVLSTGQN